MASSKAVMKMEGEYAAHNYHPLPCVFVKAEGVNVWDPEGRKYYDFLSAYSAVNQGHCHPKIVDAMVKQAHACTLSSRAFYNDQFPNFAKFVTEYVGYEMMLPMNTGAEAVETGVKLARKWSYQKKKVPENEALIICCNGCFHGRTMLAISMSDDPSSYGEFGPFLPGIIHIDYDDIDALAKVLAEKGDKVAAFIVEPIQGEAGIKVPKADYLKKAHELCKKHNVLLICDEIQTGLSRTGKLLCQEHSGVKADIVLLGKALSGGVYPVSAVLASKDVMLCIRPGEHGSTYGGNPIAAAVGIAALSVLRDEKLTERADAMGKRLLAGLQEIKAACPYIHDVRGRGLLCAIELKADSPLSAWDICCLLMEAGMLCKPTHDTTIRLAPPLVITEAQVDECLKMIKDAVAKIGVIKKSDVPNRELPHH